MTQDDANAGRTLFLSGAERPWRVVDGAFDLFLVRLHDGAPFGARHPLGRVESGGSIPSFPITADWGVVGVGTLDARVTATEWEAIDAPHRLVATIRTWQQEGDASEVTAIPRGADLRPFVEEMLAAVVATHGARIEEDERSHRARVEESTHQDRQQVWRAMDELVEVLDPMHAAAAAGTNDPLLDACRLAAARLDLPLRRPEQSALPSGQQGVIEIARASRVRSRRVALDAGWWKSDAGPLVAFRRDDGSPLALLPFRGGYRAVDPAHGEMNGVDASLHATLDPTAAKFYRSFAPRPLKAWHLLRFGSFGLAGDVVILLVSGLLAGLLGLLQPIAVSKFVDVVIPGADRSLLLQLVALLVAAACGVALFEVVRAIAMLRIESHMDASVQAALWDRILGLPLPFFQRFNAGDLANRALGINAIRQVLSGSTTTTLLAGIFSLVNVALMVHYSGKLALAGVLLALTMMAVTIGAGGLELRYQRRISDLAGRISGKVLQLIKAVAKLRAAAAEQRAFVYWASDFAEQRRLVYRARLIKAVLTTISRMAPVLSLAVLFAIFAGSLGGGANSVTSGDFLAFIAAYSAFSMAMLHAATTVVDVVRVVPLYERARPILESVPEAADDRADAGTLAGGIEVAHVTFRYHDEGPIILDDVSLRAGPGESVAIVGPSGAGKSTLLRLLLGFDEPTSGAIYYDAHHLTDLDPSSVRRQIGVVLQSGQLLGGDIFGNIVGALPLTLDDAWEAARLAGLDRDIEAMPMGMHTLVSEGGVTLSGGQRQRLMIAKALVGRPRLIFFDEATSALDNPTQAIVAESLERLQATRILIAHRLSTIRNADRIYVLDEGRIVEEGNYETLLATNGLFADLARRQIA